MFRAGAGTPSSRTFQDGLISVVCERSPIAGARPAVASVGLGEDDLRADLSVFPPGWEPGSVVPPFCPLPSVGFRTGTVLGTRTSLAVSGDLGLAWARSRVVVAARAAGLPAPVQSLYPDVGDLDGLAASCSFGRSLGSRSIRRSCR